MKRDHLDNKTVMPLHKFNEPSVSSGNHVVKPYGTIIVVDKGIILRYGFLPVII